MVEVAGFRRWTSQKMRCQKSLGVRSFCQRRWLFLSTVSAKSFQNAEHQWGIYMYILSTVIVTHQFIGPLLKQPCLFSPSESRAFRRWDVLHRALHCGVCLEALCLRQRGGAGGTQRWRWKRRQRFVFNTCFVRTKIIKDNIKTWRFWDENYTIWPDLSVFFAHFFLHHF